VQAVETAPSGAPSRSHPVRCPLCGEEFELLSAPWCGCSRGHPSKICPHCGDCLCSQPDYQQPALWSDPPAALRSSGFDKLFLYYL
jgi:predicted amidophosphoribosyltransferase